MNHKIKKTILAGLAYVAIKWLIILVVGGALFTSGYWNNWFLLAVPVIGIITLLIRSKIKSNVKG